MIGKNFALVVMIILLGWALIGVGYADITDRMTLTEDRVEVEAEVVGNDIGEQVTHQGHSQSQTRYYPTVTLEYQHNGETYTDKRQLREYTSISKESVEDIIEQRFQQGATKQAYIYSDQPSEVYSNQAPDLAPYAFIGVGSLILLFTLLIVKRAKR